MINEQAKGGLRFLLVLFACMAGLLVLLGIAGMIEVDTGERMTAPACASPGGGNECDTNDDCPLDCQKCDDTKEPHKCVADCPPNWYCDSIAERCFCSGVLECTECVGGTKTCTAESCTRVVWMLPGTGPWTLRCGRGRRPGDPPPPPAPPRG